MPLDLFPDTQSEIVQDAARQPLTGLEPTFADSFGAAWRENLDFSQSTARARLTDHVVNDKLDEFYRASGQRIAFPQAPVGDDPKYAVPYGNAQKHIDKWNAEHPDTPVAWPTVDEINASAVKLSRASVAARRDMDQRPQSWASWFGSEAGDVAGAVTEPWNIGLMGLGAPWSAGVVRFALSEAGFAAAGQTGVEAQTFGFKREVDPSWSVAQAAGDVAGAGVGGLVVGGSLKGLASLWRTARGAHGWSRDVLDAGNVIEREADIAATNPLSGAEGEIAHHEAVAKGMDDVANGRAVDVSEQVSPQIETERQAVVTRDLSWIRRIKSALSGDTPTAPFEAASVPADTVLPPEHIPGYVRDFVKPRNGQSEGSRFSFDVGPLPEAAATRVEAINPDLASAGRNSLTFSNQVIDKLYRNNPSEADAILKALPDAIANGRAVAGRDGRVEIQSPYVSASGGDRTHFAVIEISRTAHGAEGVSIHVSRKPFVESGDAGGAALPHQAGPVSEAPVVAAPQSGSPAVSVAKGNIADIDGLLKPEALARTRADAATDETLFQEAGRLQLKKPDFMVGVAKHDDAGAVVIERRRLDDAMSEVDADMAAARELRSCATGSETE